LPRYDTRDALARSEHAIERGLQIGKPRRRLEIGADAEELDLKLPADDVGELFIRLQNVSVGPEQSKRRGNEKAEQRGGDDPQRQRPLEVEVLRCGESRRLRGGDRGHGAPRRF